jgi:hypothetical protein
MRPPPDRQVLVEPADPLRLLQEQEQLLRQPFCGQPVATWRQRLRRELADAHPELDPRRPWVVLGHQPLPMHPGIWFKRLLAHALARALDGQAVAVHLDLEPAGAVAWPVVRQGQVDDLTLDLPPFWYQSIATERLRSQLARLCLPPGLAPEPGGPDELPAWHGLRALLQRWEAGRLPRVVELGQSELFLGETMQAVAALIQHQDPGALHRAYNAALAAFRAERGIRSRVNPFPDLAPGELPLWVVGEGGRRTYREPDRGQRVVPKGALLAALKRLLAADLYVHGVGGAAYEPFCARLFAGAFGVRLPGFVVASASWGLDGGEHARVREGIAAFKELARSFEHNPDRLVGRAGLEPDRELGQLLQRRREALAAMRGPMVDDDREALSAELRRLNAAIRGRLEPWWAREVLRHQELVERQERLRPLARRDLPVFYHPVDGLLCELAGQPAVRRLDATPTSP